jgi:hypothetical protein
VPSKAFIFAALLASSAIAHGDPNRYTLDLRKGHDFKLLYDAGLRPWKETNSTCMVGGAGMKDITYWKFILPNGASFDYASNMANFEVMEDDSIGRIDFSGVDDMPIKDATAMTKSICSSLGIPNAGFEEMIAGLNPSSKFNDHPASEKQGWGHRETIAGIDFDCAFIARPFFDHTSAQVNITIIWPNRAPNDPYFSKPPLKMPIRDLQPPPGYEGVSMAPPPRAPNQKGVPAHDFDYYKQKIAAAFNKQAASEGITPAELKPPPPILIPGAAGTDYVAGQDYTYELPHKASAWINTADEPLDTKVRYLLQSDKDIKTLYKNQISQLKASPFLRSAILLNPSVSALDKSIHNLDVVLCGTYDGMDKVFKAHPNSLLLKEMLCHYYLYVDSQDARWPGIIESLVAIDAAVNTEAISEVKALRDANKGVEIGFKYGR